MYQDDVNDLMEEVTDEKSNVIELVQAPKEYNHKAFIVNELRIARAEAIINPTSGSITVLVVWLDSLIYELDKECAEESLKISA